MMNNEIPGRKSIEKFINKKFQYKSLGDEAAGET